MTANVAAASAAAAAGVVEKLEASLTAAREAADASQRVGARLGELKSLLAESLRLADDCESLLQRSTIAIPKWTTSPPPLS